MQGVFVKNQIKLKYVKHFNDKLQENTFQWRWLKPQRLTVKRNPKTHEPWFIQRDGNIHSGAWLVHKGVNMAANMLDEYKSNSLKSLKTFVRKVNVIYKNNVFNMADNLLAKGA